MAASGILFLSRTAPLAMRSRDGIFTLTLLAYSRLAEHQVEPWRIHWSGEEALYFWLSNEDSLLPGMPLRAELERIRSFTNGARNGRPEIHAVATHLALAPEAHSTLTSETRA